MGRQTAEATPKGSRHVGLIGEARFGRGMRETSSPQHQLDGAHRAREQPMLAERHAGLGGDQMS